ncbi:Hypothetical protein A7982_03037 [Minicystis rosea]|nr:Hypothetical protein A7982_03037 [Minicystis rosea]
MPSLTEELEAREAAAVSVLIEKCRVLGKRITIATIVLAFALTALWMTVTLALAGAREVRLAARGAILVFVLSLVVVNRAGNALLRRRAKAWAAELASAMACRARRWRRRRGSSGEEARWAFTQRA